MRRFVLRTADDVRAAWSHVQAHWRDAEPPLEVAVDHVKVTRSSEQNRLMWTMLDDIARQVNWHGNYLAAEDWKHILTASLKKQRVVPNLEGDGFVVLGARTSRMTIAEMSELVDLMEAFGAERGVNFAREEATQ